MDHVIFILLPMHSDGQAYHGREGKAAERVDEDHGPVQLVTVECVVRQEHAAADGFHFADHRTALCEYREVVGAA